MVRITRFYLIRKNELEVIKADKMPIGIHVTENTHFTNHIIPYQKNDIIYLFSDGYADQFGGENGRKFMYKPFKNLLLSIHPEEMSRQMQLLEENFLAWKGNYPQVYDVLVIGIRL